ncbi:unnamed protein product [Brachionus calyciflorus]|uniref:Protein arginine methyltransferase NDUFAF7 n=1 Tax=Brachionus calyciflorus TaxID=104777 RepID=A0A813M6U2_9BILA|nr:unnamed protein product [Brachionus calyciflorus]
MNKLKINKFLANRFLFYNNGRLKRCLSSQNFNSLEGYLHSKIKFNGPITVAEYMKEALGNPKWGYYTKKDVFGVHGDFITAPEISQIFGELIGVWFLNEYYILKNIYKNDMPNCVQLIEMGPGRGTLMSDMLRVWSKEKTAPLNVFVYMIETSPYLRKTQMKNLCNLDQEPEILNEYKSKYSENIKIVWVTDITQLPRKEAAHFFVANEFFDALPVHKFQKTPKGHREILIDFDERDKKLKFVVSPMVTMNSKFLLNLYPGYEKFEHLEISSESARYMDLVAKRLKEYNGSMLIIDYGHDGECKDTFRGFKNHKLVDVFTEPGECDLTVDVDFNFLKNIAKKSNVTCYGPVDQGNFLSQMQIGTRLQMLLRSIKSDEEKSKLVKDFKLLVNPDDMGKRFKLLSIRKFDFKQPPPGFYPEQMLK